jgi:hypothetical protein
VTNGNQANISYGAWSQFNIGGFTSPWYGIYMMTVTGMFGVFSDGWVQGAACVNSVNYADGATSRLFCKAGQWVQVTDTAWLTIGAGGYTSLGMMGWTDAGAGAIMCRCVMTVTYHGTSTL